MYFTPAVMIQAEDRAHRIGQEHNCVNVHYLYGSETVDEIIFPKLQEKFAVVTSTLDNKKMNMEVHKIKSGCLGDIVENQNSKPKLTETTKKVGNVTLDNFFKKKEKIKDNDELLINDDDIAQVLDCIKDDEELLNININSNREKIKNTESNDLGLEKLPKFD